MLRRAFATLFALTLTGRAAADAAPAEATSAEEPPRALREPERLTVGASSELMGVLAADGAALYFVSDASGTSDLMLQRPLQSAPVTLTRGLGDAVAPQLSPDGARVAYVSFERDATGDVCVRPSGGGDETCLPHPESAEQQVLWWDATSLAVLSRRGLHGDFALTRMPISGAPPTTLVARNMVGLSLSPDRRWLAYIPVERATEDIGVTFSQRTGQGIALQRLGGDSAPLVYVPRLPGVAGTVTFSERGDFLYFAQFLNDTNHDGTIDGDDHAVIFRVPFQADAARPIAATSDPEQLTSARWDCHYPAPARDVLIASCSHEGSLDVYALPLAGAVPSAWDDARLTGEIAAARDPWTRLLLYARRLALAPDAASKEPLITQMMVLHLQLGEHESAIYDAEQRLTTPAARAFGHVLAELARHRRADLALIRGETSEQYVQSERARAAALRTPSAAEPPRLEQLRRLVVSEIDDDIGDKQEALTGFRALDLTQLGDPLLAPLVARRAERLYRLRGDRGALLEVYLGLSALTLLELPQRLEYARRFVDELGRGRTRAERAGALQAYRSRVDDASELALLLDAEAALLTLTAERQEEVRKDLFALYTKNKDVDRRRALVLDALRAAARLGNEYIQYQFVTSWASSLRREQPERKYAEQLYDALVLDRAYGEGRQGALGESRGYFYGATVATDSLEAHIGFIEARTAENPADAESALDAVYEKRFGKTPDAPIAAFVRAYRIARGLPGESDPERHDERSARCLELLSRAASALSKQPQIHQIWGFVLHQRARRTGARQAAVDANRQYLLALDLARTDERLTATLLHRLGLLQASMGNHALALRYLKQRDELPHVRPLEELGLRVALARSAWHTGDAALARDQLTAAAKLVGTRPELSRYEPLVVDRLGLALSATGEAEAARVHYERLEQLLRADATASPGNQLKAQLGIAASALRGGHPQRALAALDAADRLLAAKQPLEPEPKVVWRRSLIDDPRYTPLQYRALVAGLRAMTARALGDHERAREAVRARVQLLEQRLEETDADEDRLELAQAYLHLAELSHHVGDLSAATEAVEHGLLLAAAYNESTGSEVNDVELALIKAYAELRLYGHVRRDAMKRDATAELQRAYAVLCKYRNPRLFPQRFLFKTYLAELALPEPRARP